MLINIAIFESENFSGANIDWVVECIANESFRLFFFLYLYHNSQGILFFLTLKFSLKKFLFISHLLFFGSLQNVLVLNRKAAKVKFTLLPWHCRTRAVFAIAIGSESSHNYVRIYFLCVNLELNRWKMTQQQSRFTQSKHAMRILGDESAFCCMIER